MSKSRNAEKLKNLKNLENFETYFRLTFGNLDFSKFENLFFN